MLIFDPRPKLKQVILLENKSDKEQYFVDDIIKVKIDKGVNGKEYIGKIIKIDFAHITLDCSKLYSEFKITIYIGDILEIEKVDKDD